jgi:site-specific DNA recombinase
MPSEERVRRGAIYARLSRNRKGLSESIANQLATCRKVAAEHGIDVVRELKDDDRSAYTGAPRPGYNALLDLIKGDLIDVVIARQDDRLYRRVRDLEDFIDVVEDHHVGILTAFSGRIDLTTRQGRAMARMGAVLAQDESDAKRERLRDNQETLAEQGRWHGGTRPYGYLPIDRQSPDRVRLGGLVVEPSEAAIIKDCADRVLRGESLHAICQDLDRSEVPTVKGTGWRAPTLRRILTSFTVAGIREREGKPAGPARWQPILDEVTHARLRRRLLDQARTRTVPARVNLLTGGLSVCGLCNESLFGQRRESGRRVLQCIAPPSQKGCGGISVTAETLEQYVVDMVLVRLDGPALAEVAARTQQSGDDAFEHVAAELKAVEERLNDWTDMFANGEIDRVALVRGRKAMEENRTLLTDKLAALSSATTTTAYLGRGAELRSEWDRLSLDQQRTIIGAVVETVVINKSLTRGPVFNPDRVDIRWRV